VESSEERNSFLVANELGFRSGHERPHVVFCLLEDLVVVDVDLFHGAIEIVPEGLENQILVTVEKACAFAFGGFRPQTLPKAYQGIQISIQIRLELIQGIGASDDSTAFRDVEAAQLLAQLLASLLVFQLPRDATGVVERGQHQITTREAQAGGQRRSLLTDGLLDHLDQDRHALLEDFADLRTLASFPGLAMKGLGHDVVPGEKAVALGAVFDESGVEARFDLRYDSSIDVASAHAGFGCLYFVRF